MDTLKSYTIFYWYNFKMSLVSIAACSKDAAARKFYKYFRIKAIFKIVLMEDRYKVISWLRFKKVKLN